MQFEIQVKEYYNFIVEVSGVVDPLSGKVVFIAKALNASMMSYWDSRAEYRDDSIEGVINKIAIALKETLSKQNEF